MIVCSSRAGFALVCVVLFDLLFSAVYFCVLFYCGWIGSGVVGWWC